MTTKILYSVTPVEPSEMTHVSSGPTTIVSNLNIAKLITIVVGLVLIFVNLFSGGYGWLVCVVVLVFLSVIEKQYQSEADLEFRIQVAKREAEIFSKQLNEILSKSEDIVSNILPYFEVTAQKCIEKAKNDFSENALYPFWERIEETCNYLGCYNEAVNQLTLLGETYTKILIGKTHKFPIPFPIGTNISISQSTLDEFNSIVRKAHTKPDFANIFGHIKTQKVLIAGFQTLSQAINNMSDAIVSSINGLQQSIKSNFKELKNIQIEQIKSFEAGNKALNNTLSSMDNKLYYMQYKEKPRTPFVRPHFD